MRRIQFLCLFSPFVFGLSCSLAGRALREHSVLLQPRGFSFVGLVGLLGGRVSAYASCGATPEVAALSFAGVALPHDVHCSIASFPRVPVRAGGRFGLFVAAVVGARLDGPNGGNAALEVPYSPGLGCCEPFARTASSSTPLAVVTLFVFCTLFFAGGAASARQSDGWNFDRNARPEFLW